MVADEAIDPPSSSAIALPSSHNPAIKSIKEMKPPVQNPPTILAVVIGINQYTGAGYTNLTGAVGDADSFERFLKTRLQVPDSNICSLRDSAATREGILNAFTFLRDTDIAETGCEIIIYYAGHGAQEDTPPDWTDWYTPTGRIEMLCPSDIGLKKAVQVDGREQETVVPGIPDRTISVLLNQISLRKGNHITVILDCCSSAGMNRGPSGEARMIPRQIYNAPPINSAIDRQYFHMDKRDVHKSKEHLGRFRASHVLLAACGREQLAWEDPETKRGIFTHSLLNILEGDELETLTYRALMDKLVMPKKQTPHCEGEGVNHLLFGNREFGADTGFIYGRRTKDKPSHIEAGAAQGITPGTIFAVHKTNIKDTKFLPNPCIGYVMGQTVTEFTTTLAPAPRMVKCKLPARFYCKALDAVPQSISLFSEDKTWLQTIFGPDAPTGKVRVVIADDVESCNFELIRDDGMVYFERNNDPIVIDKIGKRLPDGIPDDDVDAIRAAVKAAAHFAYHLTRTAPHPAENVHMELHTLECYYTDDFDEVLKPVGDNLLNTDGTPSTVLVDDNRNLGLTIKNETDKVLYPYLFYFDPNDFSITDWYSPPLAAGGSRLTASIEVEMPSISSASEPGTASQTPSTAAIANAMEAQRLRIGVDAALPPHASLGVGYGNSGSQPWKFFVPPEQRYDIGFFRLFLATRPGNFQSIAQSSPFESRRGSVARRPEGPEADQWMVLTATVIQEQTFCSFTHEW